MEQNKQPEITVFVGPNGSGKSTITEMVSLKCAYVNADEIKKALDCTDYEATKLAYDRRDDLIQSKKDFAFETVLSSHYNMDLLTAAKKSGYFIKCFYILTCDPLINVTRVAARVKDGGHDVPKDKIISRYYKTLKQLPSLIDLCDVIHIYDNTKEPFRIFKKRKSEYFYWENKFWNKEKIETLTKIKFND